MASGLGATSAYTWLKLPVVADMELVAGASTLPVLLLGGEVPDDPAGVVDTAVATTAALAPEPLADLTPAQEA